MKYVAHLFFLFLLNNCIAGDSLSVRYLGIDQGLSNNAVTCIHRDNNGFMWFGTYDGLNKYDGYSFAVFRNIIDDNTSLRDNHIYCLGSDDENNVWVGTAKGLCIYNALTSVFAERNFKKAFSQQTGPLRDMALSVKKVGDTMMVGTAKNGLVIFPGNSQTGQQVLLPGSKRGDYSISLIEYDSLHKCVWLYANYSDLWQYDLKSGKMTLAAAGITPINTLFVRKDGSILAGTNSGVFTVTKNKAVPYSPVPQVIVRDIAEDPDHRLYIATDGNGLLYLSPDDAKAGLFNATGDIINSNSIYDVYIDAAGRKWIGTLRGGINIIEQNKSLFTTVSYNSKENVNDFILSFCEDDKSNLWIGTDGAGLRYWDRNNNAFSKYIHTQEPGSISNNFVTSVTKDSRNDIWISTWFGGINKLKKAGNTFKHYTCYNPFKKYDENNVWLMFEDSKKRLWASASNGGCLYLYERAADKFELFDSSLNDFQVMTEDRSGNLWGGNFTSLIQVDPISKRHRIFNIGYPVRSIHEDRNHHFWIGTEGGGLLLFDRLTGKYTRLTTRDGLPNNAILRILEDDGGSLWMSTYSGLCRFNSALGTFRNFTVADGLQSNQFSFNAAQVSKNGQFLFGGIKGFNLFYPNSIYDKKNMPNLFLTALKIDNAGIESNGGYVTDRNKDILTGITIPFSKAILSFEFTALEYTYADKLKYAYFLKGWDKNWNIVNNARAANYSHLNEGNYAFYVKVMNADGVWSAEKQLLSVKVLPPWFRTWWAYGGYAILVIGVIYIYLLYNKRQERLRYEVKLALLDKEKEKELTERKIAFFTHISHEFRTPLTLIINPLKELADDVASEKSRKKLMTVRRNAKRLLSLVDQLLLFRKVESIDQQLIVKKFDLKEACNEVFLSFTQLASSKQIHFVFQNPDKEVLYCGDKEKIEIILFNLLSNALKYTPAGGTVSLTVSEDRELVIIVKDTGCGITPEAGSRLFEPFYRAGNSGKSSQTGFGIGLYVSRKLALAHSGTLSWTSSEGQGSAFTLTLPLTHINETESSVTELTGGRVDIINELVEDVQEEDIKAEELPLDNKSRVIDKVISGLPIMLIVDDNAELRSYLKDIFNERFTIYEADDGLPALEIIKTVLPDIVVSDVFMKKMDGIALCRRVKEDKTLAHVPVILLTASASEQSKLRGLEYGAEDYINKPFDKDFIVTRVQNILKSRSRLQQYFFNTVTLQPTSSIEANHKEFLERCIEIIEAHLDDAGFTVYQFCQEIGMSHPALYKNIKAVSGLTVNVFVRYLRLRKAAELLINTNKTIVEVTYNTGFNDMKYFREQFLKLFGMNPSEYVKRYRKTFGNKFDNKIAKEDS